MLSQAVWRWLSAFPKRGQVGSGFVDKYQLPSPDALSTCRMYKVFVLPLTRPRHYIKLFHEDSKSYTMKGHLCLIGYYSYAL